MTRLATALLLAGSLLLLGGDILQVTKVEFLWTVLLALAFLCFGAGLLLLPVAFSWTGRPLVIAGVASAFVGCFAGAGMQVLFRVWEVLERANLAAAADLLRNHTLLSLSTLVPGIFFPVGLLLLAIGLMRARAVPLGTSLTLALGAVLFPIGHAAGFVPALIGGDLVLLAAFSGLFMGRTLPPSLSRPAVVK